MGSGDTTVMMNQQFPEEAAQLRGQLSGTPPPDRLPSSSTLDTDAYSPVPASILTSTNASQTSPEEGCYCDSGGNHLTRGGAEIHWDVLSPPQDEEAGGPQEGFKLPQVISSSTFTSAEESSSGTSVVQREKGGKPTALRAKKNQAKKDKSNVTVTRRQKRLERNRESARLSRRRRKHYLEELEERVNALSDEMDQGRRAHVQTAFVEMKKQREKPSLLPLPALDRTNGEMKVTNTFLTEQLQSFALNPADKFLLWMTLQNDAYFRGGRAASERLSAARIGERMLHSGNTKATPAQSMWPLLCNEIGLSYEQEEKVRTFQRTLLQTPESFLDRHGAYAARCVMKASHDALQAVTLRLGQRERGNMKVLTTEQQAKFMTWSAHNKARIADKIKTVPGTGAVPDGYQVAPGQHVAVNLYVLNHKLQRVLHGIPPAAPMATGSALKKLSVRPCFESLGCRQGTDTSHEDNNINKMPLRDMSSGSLKRSASEMSMDGEDRNVAPSISPGEAQMAARELVESVLGPIRAIVPAPPTPTVLYNFEPMVMPTPTPVSSMNEVSHELDQDEAPQSSTILSLRHQYQSEPNLTSHQFAAIAPYPSDGRHHQRESSFLPANLNVVPEELWPTDPDDDMFMDLVDDWAIGEGVDMDM